MTAGEDSRGTLTPLKQAFLQLQAAEERIRQLESAAAEPVAVVGMGCRIPGAERGPDAYWRLLRDRRCAVSGRVEERLRAWTSCWGLPEAARYAALLDRVDLFDAQHFGISPREAAAMDPQQRLLLEVTWEALEHAGISPGSLYQSSTGVYVGISSHDYALLQIRDGELNTIHPHHASGTALSIAAGRIAYTLGLNGPAMSIDTACSSSLVAVHLACEALRHQQCSMALAGGVNLILAAEASVAFAQTGMLSPRGVCSALDRSADGFVRGEGCGVVVLKRLKDAKDSGDRVLALILGSVVNQDGASSGLTAPNGRAQQALLREAHRLAGIEPWQVGYLEAHGTGTPLGDPVEAAALGAVFSGRQEKLAIGSVKSNVGHLEAAAGVAGLIKVALSLEHGEIPGQVHWTAPSEHLRWQDLPLEVKTESTAWQPIEGRRIGGVSSFGFSGTNAHVVMESYPRGEAGQNGTGEADVLCLSAGTEGALRQMVREYADFLRDSPCNWAEICHTAEAGRSPMPERIAVVASSSDAAARELERWLRGETMDSVHRGRAQSSHRGAAEPLEPTSPEMVAALFVQGNDRARMRRAGKLRRAVLPTYAFQRESYWFKDLTEPPEGELTSSVAARTESAVIPDLRSLVANARAEQRVGVIRCYLQAETARVLQIPVPDELDGDRPLMELGMDSLMALELKNKVQQSSGITLPANFLFEYPTIGKAAIYLNAVLGSGPAEVPSQGDSPEHESVSL